MQLRMTLTLVSILSVRRLGCSGQRRNVFHNLLESLSHKKSIVRYVHLLYWFIGINFLVPAIFAQSTTTSLRGVITDPTGAPVPSASVVIEDSDIGFHIEGKSDTVGRYFFQQLKPGEYVITVRAPGFAPQSLHATLLVAQPATADAQLSLGATETSINVSAATQTLNTTDATIGNAIPNEVIQDLPSYGRNPATLLALQPGVLFIGENTSSSESRNGVVSGARSDQTNLTLDGIDNNNQVYPSAFSGVLYTPIDSTEEFRVTTSNANVDSGRSSGGQVSLVTKAGTNSIHGTVYEYNRNTLGVANDWFNKQSQLASGKPNLPPKLVQNVYGAAVGGPLRKGTLFLFGNYEGQRIFSNTVVQRTVPTDSFSAGNLSYRTAGGVTTLTPAQFASMDSKCSSTGTCPSGPGVNPNVLKLFNTYPKSNSTVGGDGLNTGTYIFTSPAPNIQNVYVGRLDFNPNDINHLYVRGSLQSMSDRGAEFFPGQGPSSTSTDDSRGIAVNYTKTISSRAINNLRYGFIRQSYGTTGAGNGDYVSFNGLSLPESSTRSSGAVVPMHNLLDDFSYTGGKHTLQLGVNYRRFTFESSTDGLSYNSAIGTYTWLRGAGYVGSGGSFDPTVFGFPAPANSTTYNTAVTQLAGLVDKQVNALNYTISKNGTTGVSLADGVSVQHAFHANQFEYYIADTWQPRRNLTIIAGIRHSIAQTPYEINGQQVSAYVLSDPKEGLHQWFVNRGVNAALGQSVQPELTFGPSGQARGGKPFFPMSWGNVAPRLSIAFAPYTSDSGFLHTIFGDSGKSSIRAGVGIYYDNFGEGLIANYSKGGSYSLNSTQSNAAYVLTADTSPRYTGLHNLPGLLSSSASSISYPQTPSDDPLGSGFLITSGLDSRIKTPYSEAFDLSWQRQLSGGFTLEADYVGRLGRHLLESIDLAQPSDLTDGGGMDYYTAATMLTKYANAGATNVPAIPYFEDLFANAKTPTMSATQNIYTSIWRGAAGNETAALYDLDVYCQPGCAHGRKLQYWPSQYSSLFVKSSVGVSSYNAGQFILRHPMKNNVSFDVSYTYSKSLDLGSDTETNSSLFSVVRDSWDPHKNYGVSDFDTRHLLTGDWVLKIPTGKNEHFLANHGVLVDKLVGGWTFTGIARLSSGLPFMIMNGTGWTTNWEIASTMIQTAPITIRKHINSNGVPQVFDNPTTALKAMRNPYPGEAEQRNHYRGDGYFDVDAGLHKVLTFRERYRLDVAAEAYNVSNSARFDPESIDRVSTDSQVGVYGSMLVSPRRFQFSGRFSF